MLVRITCVGVYNICVGEYSIYVLVRKTYELVSMICVGEDNMCC